MDNTHKVSKWNKYLKKNIKCICYVISYLGGKVNVINYILRIESKILTKSKIFFVEYLAISIFLR